MKILTRCPSLPALFLTALLVGCGGGGGGGGVDVASVSDPGTGSGGGIGGTGVTASGTIDGFGSIFVNGVEFETDEAEIIVDGDRVSDDALRLGMVVLVSGTINDGGVTGLADRVVFDDEVQGPVSSIEPGQDDDSLLLDILGVSVIVERTGTVFDATSFDTIAVGDILEVSGFPAASGTLRATRLEKKTGTGGAAEVELKGAVANLVGAVFTLGQYSVDFSGADLSGVPGGELSNGLVVEVHGTLEDALILASRIEREDGIAAALDAREVSVQGTITGFAGRQDFNVNGVAVNGSDATLQPADLVLGNGQVVEVDGTWDGSVLTARKIEARRGRVEIEAAVEAVGPDSVTLQLATGTVVVQLNVRTLMEDDTGRVEPLTLAQLGVGDFLEVEAVMVGSSLVATRIDRDDMDDDVVQAPVESFVAGDSVTLLGLTYSLAGARFEDQNDNPVSEAEVFAALQVGKLVKIKDEETADGIADEVEFEFEGGLDGELEFGDDEEGDSNSDSDDDSHDDSSSDDEHGEAGEADEADDVDAPDEVDEPDEVDDPDEADSPDEVDEPDQPDDASSGPG
jgi:hypothetical protein